MTHFRIRCVHSQVNFKVCTFQINSKELMHCALTDVMETEREKKSISICECVINHLSPLSSRIKPVASNAFPNKQYICITCNAWANIRWLCHGYAPQTQSNHDIPRYWIWWKSGGKIMAFIKYSYDMLVAGSESLEYFWDIHIQRLEFLLSKFYETK